MLRWLWRVGAGGRAVVAIAICLMAAPAWSQETRPGGAKEAPPAPVGAPTPERPAPPVSAYPLELLGLLAPPAQRGQVSLTPSIAASEEYNDNIFLNNQNRQWDLITGFTPALTLFVNRPAYQLTAGYSFTAEMYDRNSRFNNVLDRQNFVGSGLYRATPGLTLNAFETYALDRNTNRLAAQGFATGRQESWSNTFGPGLTWQLAPRTSLNLGATYGVTRFKGGGTGRDSDTYGFLSGIAQGLTPRLTATAGYGFTYLETRGQEDSRTHSPTVGFIVRLTPTLTGSVSGGPAITELGGKTFLSPAGTASLDQRFEFGSASVRYTRAVSTAGGLGGTTDTQTASATLTLPALSRSLLVVFNPVYSIAESVSSRQPSSIDLKALTLNLSITYQLARYVSVFGGYTFLQQRAGGGTSTAQIDVDQNRARFGLQFGYPINFD